MKPDQCRRCKSGGPFSFAGTTHLKVPADPIPGFVQIVTSAWYFKCEVCGKIHAIDVEPGKEPPVEWGSIGVKKKERKIT